MTKLEQIDVRRENGNAMIALCFPQVTFQIVWPWRCRTETMAEYTKRKVIDCQL